MSSKESSEIKKEVKLFSRVSGPGRCAAMVETIVGCKWSLTVYQLLASDINRPGEMMRSVEGLSTKVLNQCLRKNVDFGILKKTAYPEIPPRVEYQVTEFGQKFMLIMDSLQSLQIEIEADLEESAEENAEENIDES